MARFVPNPNFNLNDAIKDSKGKFTCHKCGEKFEKTGLRLPDGKLGFACPKCGFKHYIKS
jgi:DNA-directed RNA polymerase subunit RPC12/RpoP